MTIAVDFDGVLHDYTEGWRDGTIYGSPVPGGFEALAGLMANDAVCVFTSRSPDDAAEWLQHHGGFRTVVREYDPDKPFWDERGVLLVTDRKPPATAYIDDRGIRFRSWPQALAALADPDMADRPFTLAGQAETAEVHTTTTDDAVQTWQQVGWIGHSGALYGLGEKPSQHEPGGWSPLWRRIENQPLDNLRRDDETTEQCRRRVTTRKSEPVR